MVMTDNTGFDAVFAEIRSTRARYEALRAAGGPLDERARMVSALHALRADLARLRPNVL